MDKVLITENPARPTTAARRALLAHPWLKTFGITGFMTVFFIGYFYLLRHPAFPVWTVPATALDSAIAFRSTALPIYLSLWVYVSLPPALMVTRVAIVAYGFRIAALCLTGLAVFYRWPNTMVPAAIDWDNHPSVVFLKGIDTAGNACPSLHVATAVFSGVWLHWRIKQLGFGWTVQTVNAAWCLAIAYSTLAIKQHVVLDVTAGALLGLAFAWAGGLKAHAGR